MITHKKLAKKTSIDCSAPMEWSQIEWMVFVHGLAFFALREIVKKVLTGAKKKFDIPHSDPTFAACNCLCSIVFNASGYPASDSPHCVVGFLLSLRHNPIFRFHLPRQNQNLEVSIRPCGGSSRMSTIFFILLGLLFGLLKKSNQTCIQENMPRSTPRHPKLEKCRGYIFRGFKSERFPGFVPRSF